MSNGDAEQPIIDLVAIQELIQAPWREFKQWRGLNLKRAMHSGYAPAAPTNRATHALYNNTNANDVLIVRSVNYGGNSNAASLLCSTSTTIFGTSLGTVVPMLPDRAPGPGLHYYQDHNGAVTPDFIISATAVGSWMHDFPISVLPPGWNFTIQLGTSGAALGIGFLWEFVQPDELEQWFGYK